MKTVLYLCRSHPSSCAQLKFQGAQQRLLAEGYCLRKVTADRLSPSALRELAAFWNVCGLIADCGGQRPIVIERHLTGTPVVYLDIARETKRPHRHSVSYDIRATCHLAAKELLTLDCSAYGYAGYGKTIAWSEERKRVFSHAMRLNGHEIVSFDLNPAQVSPSDFYRRLADWLRQMPKPLAIFAADDAYAVHLHAAATQLGFRIPADVAILGVDDESALLPSPAISSIQLDFHKAGILAAELLVEILANPSRAHDDRHFGPVQLIRRSSTRKIRVTGDNLAAVINRIREEAPHGLTAANVASWMKGSRRLAEMRFRQATGHSILEEIASVRIDRAKELLANTANPIGTVGELCGYRTFNAFRNAFKARTGLTPREWRRNVH